MGKRFGVISAIATVFIWLSPGYAAEDGRMPFFAKSQDEIAVYFETGRLQKIDFHGDELLAVAHDIGSGLTILVLYIYIGSDADGWSLLAYHRSFASGINVRLDADTNEVIAVSKSGRILLKIPHESLKGDYLDQLQPPR